MKIDDFSGYILAGGKSSRMGSDKALLEFDGRSFAENAVKILTPICDNRIKIVLNSNQTDLIEKLPVGVEHISDIYKGRGPLGGMHAAFSDCTTEFAILLAVDMPLVNSSLIELLAKEISASDVNAVIPFQTEDSKLQPLCGIYRVPSCLVPIEELLMSKRKNSVNNYLDLLVTKDVNVGDRHQLFNANTEKDMITLLEQLSGL